MRFIAHRANLYGPNPETENTLESIQKCIELDFDFEIDLWVIDDELFLGHDKPQYKIDKDAFLDVEFRRRAWVHCKNLEALVWCNETVNEELWFDFFWHDKDEYTLTASNIIWCNIGKFAGKNSVLLLPEQLDIEERIKMFEKNADDINIICTDYAIQTQDSLVPQNWGA